jgi:hypothetical protein
MPEREMTMVERVEELKEEAVRLSDEMAASGSFDAYERLLEVLRETESLEIEIAALNPTKEPTNG